MPITIIHHDIDFVLNESGIIKSNIGWLALFQSEPTSKNECESLGRLALGFGRRAALY